MLIERDLVPAFSIYLYCKSLPSTVPAQLPEFCSPAQWCRKSGIHVRLSEGKTMPRMYLQQDYFKIIFYINEAVWLLEAGFKPDFYF